MRHCAWMLVLAVGAGMSSGCVERRYVINSDPPGALVLRNGQPIGAAPADDHFVYYGDYEFTLVKDGYETLKVKQHIPAPWYQWFPLDVVSEVFFPWRIEDVRRFTYPMTPVQPVRPDELVNHAQVLRNRGKTLGPTNPPEAPPTPQVPPAPPILAAPGTVPPASPAPPVPVRVPGRTAALP